MGSGFRVEGFKRVLRRVVAQRIVFQRIGGGRVVMAPTGYGGAITINPTPRSKAGDHPT